MSFEQRLEPRNFGFANGDVDGGDGRHFREGPQGMNQDRRAAQFEELLWSAPAAIGCPARRPEGLQKRA